MSKEIKDILFITQAREGSTRISNKMTRSFAGGKTLFTHCLNIVKNSNIPLNNFRASVGETVLQNEATKSGVLIFNRSKESAEECEDLRKIFEWNTLPFKYYIMISACCPFLQSSTINSFIDAFTHSPHEGMMSVVKRKNILWDETKVPLNFEDKKDFQTQTLESYYEAAHCLYAGNLQKLKEECIHMGSFTAPNDPDIFEINEEEAFDIDVLWQFKLAQNYLKQKSIT